jgi:hypothetical protein
LSSGVSEPAKTVGVTFAIYRQQDGGAPLWLETQNVTPDSTGHYTVLLGSTKADGVPADLFNTQEQRWLGVQVQREAEQARVLLVSVPYAMKAADAETVGGLPPSAFVLKPPSSKEANETAAPGSVMAPALAGQIGGGGTTNYIPIWTSNTNLGNSTIYETGGNVGIGTTTPTSMLTVAGSVSGTSVNASTAYQIKGNNILSTSGTQNVFLGQQAGQHNTSGEFNVFSGYGAGSSNTTGSENSFLGHQAGNLNATGRANTFLGNIAGENNTSGGDNTFLGARAGASNTSGNNNVFAGFVTGNKNTTGSQNVFLGNGAGLANTTGQNNTLVGWASGSSNVTGTDNIYLGYTSGRNATGSNNIYLGEISSALNESNTIRIGTNQTTTYIQGVINGYGAGLTGVMPACCSPYYIQNGGSQQAGASFNIDGNGTLGGTLVANAISSHTGFEIEGISFAFGSSTSGNAFLGFSGNTTMTGILNTASGYAALIANTMGGGNTASGNSALETNTTGSWNTASGYAALGGNSKGNFNTANGYLALNYSTGSWNTASGALALYSNTIGSRNTALGFSADVGNPDLSNATAIGAQAYVTQSNSLVLGSINGVNGANASTNIGIGTTAPIYPLDVNGNARITGTLTKGGGSFKIDHPLDPANKYLSHSFVESPDMMNIYNGNVVTNKRGLATIELPDWFEALNRDFRYQLTVIGQFAQAIVVKEVRNHQFTIKTSKPGVKVSWQVTGIRQDAYANAHRITVEEAKPPEEQGHYLHPELFGAGPEKSVTRRSPESSTANPPQTAELSPNGGSSQQR